MNVECFLYVKGWSHHYHMVKENNIILLSLSGKTQDQLLGFQILLLCITGYVWVSI